MTLKSVFSFTLVLTKLTLIEALKLGMFGFIVMLGIGIIN